MQYDQIQVQLISEYKHNIMLIFMISFSQIKLTSCIDKLSFSS